MADMPVIYVVDDDEPVRDSLAVLLEAEGFAVCACASAEALRKAVPLASQGCVLLDVRMPGEDGLSLLAWLSGQPDGLPVIMITGHGDVAMAVRAMKQGAIDFIEKPFVPDELLAAVRAAIGRQVLPIAPAANGALPLLTPREREVLEQLVIGRSNKLIGRALGISPRTVEIHRARLMEKMQADSLPQLVRMALAAGIDPQDA
jgi:two-component system response regulator FixJ